MLNTARLAKLAQEIGERSGADLQAALAALAERVAALEAAGAPSRVLRLSQSKYMMLPDRMCGSASQALHRWQSLRPKAVYIDSITRNMLKSAIAPTSEI